MVSAAFANSGQLKLKDGQSLCLQAENGRGKTSISDALEFWSTGDVAWTHRDGVGLAALIHLDRDEALVEVQVDGVGVASRRLRGNVPGPLEPGSGPLVVDFATERLPVLGHRTMAQFVDKTANDKRSELLEALGLDDLGIFRAGVRSVKSQLKRRAKEASKRQDAAKQAMSAHLGEQKLEDALARLSTSAKLDPRLDHGDDLIGWEPPAAQPPESSSPLSHATELASAREELAQASTDLWATATEDRATAEQRGLSTLLEAGSQVLAASDEDRCPLCLIEQDREALIERITERATDLATADEKFREAEQQLTDEAVERAIKAELDRINEPLANYYAQLVGQPAYTDLCLTYTQARAGGIEFEFKWDGRHDVRPPQKVMSESELNALGLALFLARLKTDPPGWRTMVLDDVVASFDAASHPADPASGRRVRRLAGDPADP